MNKSFHIPYILYVIEYWCVHMSYVVLHIYIAYKATKKNATQFLKKNNSKHLSLW